MTKKSASFADFINFMMREKGWSNRELAARARVSFRVIGDCRSGKFEKSLARGDFSKRKHEGMSGSIYRILVGLGEAPEDWMDTLKLPLPTQTSNPARKFQDQVHRILPMPLSVGDIEQLGRVAKELGELFTVEMALQVLIRKL